VSVSVNRVPPAADALAHLTEISTQIEAAVVLDREGKVQAATVDDERADRIARAALELFRQADAQREQELVQLDAALADGSVLVVRDEERLIAATTGVGPTAGLVFYDLKSALRSFAEEKPKPKPRARRAAPAKRATTTRKKSDAGS
jgi:predicted regulator of Ras-like GTPase activity (Roadblock/LC7/MglB family)